jgi:galactose mutarotase-like enzyme
VFPLVSVSYEISALEPLSLDSDPICVSSDILRPHGESERGSGYPVASYVLLLFNAARLMHRASGRVLDVSTSTRSLQLSTASDLKGVKTGKSGMTYGMHSGISLQCAGNSDGIRHPELGSILLRPGQVKRHASAYSFSTINDSAQRVA